jgi:hypothetical protein
VTGRIAVETNMGAISAVMQYGSEAQKQLAARLVLEGDKPAICITEPEAGSAATDMTTRADRRNGYYLINGRKHWITGGGVSKLHLIFARVFDEAGRARGIGGFLAVRDDAQGLVIGKREPTMGLRGIPETEIRFENLEVPDEMVLQSAGRLCGFADLMNAYNSQRVGAATVALGLAQGAFEAAVAFAKERQQFGRPIGEFQGLQWMLADMAIQLNAARLGVYRAAASADPFPDPLLAAQAKVFASEMAIKVTNDALQMFGARGYSRDYPMERMARDARMFTIGGGTAQVLRNFLRGGCWRGSCRRHGTGMWREGDPLRYSSNISRRVPSVRVRVASSTAPRRRTSRCRSSVRSWSSSIRPFFRRNRSGTRYGAGWLPVVIGATVTVRR